MDGLLDIGIGQVLCGEMEGGLDFLIAEMIQKLSSVVSGSIVEGEGNDTVGLAAIANSGFSDRKECSKNKSEIKIHDFLIRRVGEMFGFPLPLLG